MSDWDRDKLRREGDGQETAQETRFDPPAPARRPLTPAQTLQRTVGNSRLLQLRAAAQRQLTSPENTPDWVRNRVGERQRNGQLEQEQMEQEADRMVVPSGGAPLTPSVQARAEAHLGVPMGDVRVVTGADESCNAIQAKAYTTQDGSTPKVVMASGSNPALTKAFLRYLGTPAAQELYLTTSGNSSIPASPGAKAAPTAANLKGKAMLEAAADLTQFFNRDGGDELQPTADTALLKFMDKPGDVDKIMTEWQAAAVSARKA